MHPCGVKRNKRECSGQIRDGLTHRLSWTIGVNNLRTIDMEFDKFAPHGGQSSQDSGLNSKSLPATGILCHSVCIKKECKVGGMLTTHNVAQTSLGRRSSIPND